jgi:uncharacterized protein YgfB (UPF0149 family)
VAEFNNYDSIGVNLENVGLEMGAAEAHALTSGLICGDVEHSMQLMLQELLPDFENADALAMESKREFIQMHGVTLEQLDDPVMAFELLLPSEQNGHKARAQALVHWCQGFLYGFGVSVKQTGRKLGDEAREAIEDITEFTRLDTDSLSDTEIEEEMVALSELEEYLRVAVMTIYQDMLPQ